MKLKSTLWALALACAAVSCSDDLENGPGSNGTDENNGQKAYLKINISTVSDGMMTKADPQPSNPNNNQDGTTAGAGWGEDGNGWLGELPGKNEGMVYDINVFLVKADVNNRTLNSNNQLNLFNQTIEESKPVAIDGQGYYDLKTNEGKGLDVSVGGEEDEHGSRNVTITMQEDLGETDEHFQVFTIVNAGTNLSNITTLKALREYIQNGAVQGLTANGTNAVADADKFIMSTHKMISSSNNLNSTVALSNKNTAENPAKTAVYVERLAARIDLAYPENGTLAFNNTSSPVNGMGDFTLTDYMVVNQWNGGTNMFKQVSPTVSTGTVNITTTTYASDDPKQYLGDEVWSNVTSSQKYNFVYSEEFANKKKASTDVNDAKWDNLYINHFDLNLNNENLLAGALPAGLSYTEESNSKTYYPIAYVRENTMNTDAQVHDYSTGVIFQTQFSPNSSFKLMEYNNNAISEVNLSKDKDGNFQFLTAEHFDGKEVHKLVYKDVKTVAARAFNIAEGDTKGLLKGFMEGWTGNTTATLADVQTAVAGMSEKNLLSKKFKRYLNENLENKTAWDETLQGLMTYSTFIGKQTQAQQNLLNITDLSTYTSSNIEDLARDYGIYFFRNGKSYHKFWIRHNDNNDDYKMGVMEFAIVRNNVYQLNVTGVKGLGDPLPFTPGKDKPETPDESNEVTINVTIYVKDWVKRTNKDIILQ